MITKNKIQRILSENLAAMMRFDWFFLCSRWLEMGIYIFNFFHHHAEIDIFDKFYDPITFVGTVKLSIKSSKQKLFTLIKNILMKVKFIKAEVTYDNLELKSREHCFLDNTEYRALQKMKLSI